MKKGFILVFGVWCLVFAMLGCETMGNDSSAANTPNLEPAIMAKFSDIPVPSGYKFLDKDSYVFQAGRMRVGILKYSGKSSADQVVNFYREQMPMFGWNLINTFEYGARLLNFDKETESCVINIDTAKNIVVISIGPKSQAPAKKADKPIK